MKSLWKGKKLKTKAKFRITAGHWRVCQREKKFKTGKVFEKERKLDFGTGVINFRYNFLFTTTNSHIIWKFSCKSIKKICKKGLFSAIFSKNFNWQLIPSWVIISYKIIKFASISYKICYKKYFIQNILQKNWQQFLTNLFFITKFINIFPTKKIQNKIDRKYEFF